MNNTPKLVVSTTLQEVTWHNSTLLTGNIVEELTKLKNQPGKNLNISGSPTLVRTLLQHRVLDELHLMVFPLVLGSGKRLFDPVDSQIPLRLTDCRALPNGVVALTYESESE